MAFWQPLEQKLYQLTGRFGIPAELVKQFINYLLIGGTTMVINASIVYICYAILKLNYYLATSCGYILSLVYHFSMNKYLNFKSDERHVFSQVKTYLVVAGANYLFTMLAVWFFTAILRIPFPIAFVISAILGILWTFPAQKYLTFGKGIIKQLAASYRHLIGK